MRGAVGVAPVVSGDEAEPLLGVVPLHSPLLPVQVHAGWGRGRRGTGPPLERGAAPTIAPPHPQNRLIFETLGGVRLGPPGVIGGSPAPRRGGGFQGPKKIGVEKIAAKKSVKNNLRAPI